MSKHEWKGELRQTTKAGAEIIVENRWTLVFDGGGQPKSILVINTDITEKKNWKRSFFVRSGWKTSACSRAASLTTSIMSSRPS